MTPIQSPPSESSRGQIELVSYVVITGIVLSVIGATLFVGLPALDNAQAGEESEAMERNFVRLDERASTAANHGDSTEFRMSIPPGTLNTASQRTYINITAVQGGTQVRSDSFATLVLVYEADENVNTVIYDGGLVTTRSPAAPDSPRLILSPPTSSTTQNNPTSTIRLKSIQQLPTTAIDGPATIVYAVRNPPERASQTATYSPGPTTTTTVRVNTTQPHSWLRILESMPALKSVQIVSTPDGEVVEAEVRTGAQFTISETPIELGS